MFILDRISDALALIGFMIGAWRWGYLDRSRKLIVAFLGVSAFCGIGQALLRFTDYTTAWMGNLWDLSVLMLLVPACMVVMRSRFRNPLKPILVLLLGAWTVWNLGMGGMASFNDLLSMAFYGLLAFCGAVMFTQFIEDPLKPFHKPEFILSLVALAAGSMDALNSMALAGFKGFSLEFLTGMMTTRNAVWCGAYALLAYSLMLKGRTRGELRKGVSIHGPTRMGCDEELHKRSGGPWRSYEVWGHTKDA